MRSACSVSSLSSSELLEQVRVLMDSCEVFRARVSYLEEEV